MQSRCEFLTKNERALVEILKEGPRQYSEVIDALQRDHVKKRTANNLLKESEGKLIFRVEIDGKVFYRLNIFPTKILNFFALIDQIPENQRKSWRDLTKLKDEVLRLYPKISFEQILSRQREFLKLTKPKLKGIIKTLKEFEGDHYG